jgi:hypothetical protein
MATTSVEEALLSKVRGLPAHEQQQVLDFASSLAAAHKRPLKSLEGLWTGHGIDISEEDIAEARREMWGSIDREGE